MKNLVNYFNDEIRNERKERIFNSKKKGNLNESRLAKLFSKWTGRKFVRVPMSGGLEWFKNSYGSGDIICTDIEFGRRFIFSIEVKHYKKFEIKKNLRSNTKIKTWFAQSERDSKVSNKIPLLIAKFNYGDYILFTKKKLLKVEPISSLNDELYGYYLKEVMEKYNVEEFIELYKK